MMIDLSDIRAVRELRPLLVAHRGGVVAPDAPNVPSQRYDLPQNTGIAWWNSMLGKRKTVNP